MSGIWLPHTEHHPIPLIDHGPINGPKGIVLHINQGTYDGTIGWFSNPAAGGIGAHLEIGDGRVAQLASLDRKCWHAGAGNDRVGFEHAGTTARTREQWLHDHHTELALSANRGAWVLHEFNLGRPKLEKNIWRHSDGGQAWGGHACPGPSFPVDVWLDLCMDAYMGHWGRT